MKILVLNYEFPPLGGGGGPVSYETAKGYVARGHTVDVVTAGFAGLPAREEKDGMTIYRVKCWRTKKEISHPWEQASYLISAYRFVNRELDVSSYDVCHAHFIIPTGWLALRLKKRYGLPYVLSAHGSDVLGHNRRFRFLYPLVRPGWRRIVAGASVVVCASTFLSERVRALAPGATIDKIPNSIGAQFIPQKKEKLILAASRLSVGKRVGMIVEALKSVDLGDWKVVIVGDGTELDTLKKETADNPAVTFTGWLDRSDARLAELYGKAGVFISASAFDSMPVAVLEGLAAGCYPLLSDIAPHKELALGEEHFFKDASELSEKLKSAMALPLEPFPYDVSAYRTGPIVSSYEQLLIRYQK